MKRIVVNREHLETRIALIEDGRIEEYYVQREDNRQIVGSIYKGRITNMEPSLQAAFVDVGLQKNAFLHYWDMIPASQETWEQNATRTHIAVDEPDAEEESDSTDSGRQKSVKEPKQDSTASVWKRFVNFIAGPSEEDEAEQEPEPEPEPEPKKESNRRQNNGGRNRRGRGGRRGGGNGRRDSTSSVSIEEIPERFKVNDDVVVQVTKGPIGTKGPRVTTNLSIPGRYVVLLPNSKHRGVSKRLERKEKERLRNIVRRIKLPRAMGVICRTASTGLDEQSIRTDIQILADKWNRAESLMHSKSAPTVIYEEPDVLERCIRDMLSDEIDEIVVDSKDAYELTQSYVRKLDKKDRTRVRLYDDPKPIFEEFDLNRQVRFIFHRKVKLPSGAELCIDETEALIAIDINSGKSRGGKDHPETILNTNLEAAEEVARQLRLRNIGGLVVVDFIDMRSRGDQDKVYACMKQAVSRDRAKTRILRISRLGLMEMTRQREHESLRDSFYENCKYCEGKGVVKSTYSISVEIQRRLQEILRRRRGKSSIRVTVHPNVLNRLRKEDADIIERMEKEHGGSLSFRASEDVHQEEFRFVDVSSGKEL